MIVELAAPTTMLAALDSDRHPAWAGMIRRARHRLADLPDAEQPGGPAHPAGSTADAHKRRPGRELDRWIRVRDRHCIGVGCVRAAYSVDIDHTRDWVDDGLTLAANLGGPCRHCHRLKHESGWRLHQPEPGHFEWRTRAGAVYAVTPRPVLATVPAPAPRADGRPRPVLDARPPFPDDVSPWIDLRPPRPTATPDVPHAPTRRHAAGSDDVEPPF